MGTASSAPIGPNTQAQKNNEITTISWDWNLLVVSGGQIAFNLYIFSHSPNQHLLPRLRPRLRPRLETNQAP